MKLNIQLIAGILIVLAIGMGSCNTFKDETAPDSYSEIPKNMDGEWILNAVSRNGIDITERMDFNRFRIFLNKDNTYKLEGYLPFLVKNDGTWRVDDPLYPFHLIFKETTTDEEVTTGIKLITVNGHRRITLEISPGCYSNKYIYTFEKATE